MVGHEVGGRGSGCGRRARDGGAVALERSRLQRRHLAAQLLLCIGCGVGPRQGDMAVQRHGWARVSGPRLCMRFDARCVCCTMLVYESRRFMAPVPAQVAGVSGAHSLLCERGTREVVEAAAMCATYTYFQQGRATRGIWSIAARAPCLVLSRARVLVADLDRIAAWDWHDVGKGRDHGRRAQAQAPIQRRPPQPRDRKSVV